MLVIISPEFVKHKPKYGDPDDVFGSSSQDFDLFCEAAEIAKPGKGTFDDSTLWQYLKGVLHPGGNVEIELQFTFYKCH